MRSMERICGMQQQKNAAVAQRGLAVVERDLLLIEKDILVKKVHHLKTLIAKI